MRQRVFFKPCQRCGTWPAWGRQWPMVCVGHPARIRDRFYSAIEPAIIAYTAWFIDRANIWTEHTHV